MIGYYKENIEEKLQQHNVRQEQSDVCTLFFEFSCSTFQKIWNLASCDHHPRTVTPVPSLELNLLLCGA